MRRQLLAMAQVLGGALLVGILLFGQSDAQMAGGADLLQGVKADRDKYPLGETVSITYAVRNQSNHPVTLNFTSSKLYDVWIKRGDTEVYRLSNGKTYIAAMTNMVLQPGETRSFDIMWRQADNDGSPVGPGVYDIYAQLTTSSDQPPAVRTKVQLGDTGAAVIPATIGEAIANADALVGRTIRIAATYKGWQPNQNDPNVKDGAPVSQSDWAICDDSRCMYVSGRIDLDPVKDIGAKVDVTGKLRKTSGGQVFLALDHGAVVR